MKILVTGANGYIGSKVVRQLCNDGVDVIATDINNSFIDKRARFIRANIFEEKENWLDFFENPDVCLHLAWRNGFVHNSDSHMQDLSKHFSFLKNLIDNGLKQVASMGSMHEVGYWEGKIDENTPCNPMSQYGIAKNALRKSLEIYASEKKCKFQWLRGFYIYGDDLHGNSIFCKLRKAVNEGKKDFPFTSGLNEYDFIHIDELAKQISACVKQNKILGVINCCSGKPISLAEEIETYIKANELPIKLEYGKYPERPYDSPCIYGDNTKILEIIKLSKRILVTGANGQLGHDCIRELHNRGYSNVIGIDIDDVDITNKKAVSEYIEKFKPEIVMHNAAWTAVDKAEQCPDKVYEINTLGPLYIADVCNRIGAKMVYISTDYVFDGKGTTPFEIEDKKNGLSIYGKTKAQGEDNVIKTCSRYFIVRISWAFGINGNNFVKTMIRIARSGKREITVVNDQIGSVTYTYDLAKLLCDMIETDKFGVYHATNEGYISWADFAKEIFKEIDANINVIPISTIDYKKIVPNQTDRPLNSRLSKKSLDNNGFSRLPDWKDALKRFLKEINECELQK